MREMEEGGGTGVNGTGNALDTLSIFISGHSLNSLV